MKLLFTALSVFWISTAAAADECSRLFPPGVPESMRSYFDLYVKPELLPQIRRAWYDAVFSTNKVSGLLRLYTTTNKQSLEDPAIEVHLQYDFSRFQDDVLILRQVQFHPDFGVQYAYRLVLAHLLYSYPATRNIQVHLTNNRQTRTFIQEQMARGRTAGEVFASTPMGRVLKEFGFQVNGIKTNLLRLEKLHKPVARELSHQSSIFFTARRPDPVGVPISERPVVTNPPSLMETALPQEDPQ